MHDAMANPLNRCAACGASATAEVCPACGFAPPRIDGFTCHAPALAIGGAGYDAAHYHVLADLEAGNFWFHARNQLIVAALRKHAPHMRRFLEIGCGTGFVLRGI